MAKILLGVSGGIAAYKALELVRLATGEGHSLRVVQAMHERFPDLTFDCTTKVEHMAEVEMDGK